MKSLLLGAATALFMGLFLTACGNDEDTSFLSSYGFEDGMNVAISSTVYYLPITCDSDVIAMQGSGLCDGKIVNYAGEELPAFVKPPIERQHASNIIGILNVRGRKQTLLEPLQVFASALTFDVNLYVPELDTTVTGKNLTYVDMYKDKNNKIVKVRKTVKHDGCLKNLDTGSAFTNPSSVYYRGAPTPQKLPIDLYLGLSENFPILPKFTDKKILHNGTYNHEKCLKFNWNLPLVSQEILDPDVRLEDMTSDDEIPDVDFPDEDIPDDDLNWALR